MNNTLEGKIDNLRFENDSRFLTGVLTVCHDGQNLNNTEFSKEDLMRCAENSLRECPILGSVVTDEDTGERRLNGHDIDYDLVETQDGYDIKVNHIERIYGFIPHDAKISVDYNQENNKYYIVTNCVLWRNYLDDVEDILTRQDGFCDVSMEITVDESFVSIDGVTQITDFRFLGVTMLNDSPAMKGANLKLSNFSMQDVKMSLQEMIKVYSAELEGGESVEENKEVVKVEEQQNEEPEQQEVVVTQEVTETVEVDGEVVEETVETVEKEPVEEQPEEVVTEGEGEYEKLAEEYATLKETYETLQGAYAELEEKLNAMSDYEELKAFKENYDKVAYENEVEEVAQMFSLDASETKELKEKALAKEITTEQFREKLGYKFAMKQLSKPAKQEHSSEAAILDDEEISNAPYGGYFEKYRNR